MKGDPAVVVLERLRQLRRRAIAVEAIRLSLAAMPVSIIAASILAAFSKGGAPSLLELVGIAAAVGAGAGVLGALLRAPTMLAVAMRVDRRLCLENRATAALQFVADEDPVARLVVRDGAKRLEACRTTDAFPVGYPAYSRWLLAGAVAAPLLIGAVDVSRTPIGDGGSPGAGGGATAGSGRTRPSARGATADARDAATGAGQVSQTARTEPGANEAPGAASSASGAIDARSRPESAGASPASDDRPAPGGSPAKPDADSSASRGADSAGRAASAAAVSRGASGSAAGAAAPRGGNAIGIDESTRRGGGVSGGSLMAGRNTPASSPAPALTRAQLARYRAAWDRTEAAVGKTRIPADQRPYVKAYFDAIRATVRR